MTQQQDSIYRLQPDTHTPDPNDPFAGDLMGRKPQADALVKLATGVSGPAVIAVDAPYGVGKSTFLRMVACMLDDGQDDAKAKVIEHNAWKTEFGDMPSTLLADKVMESAKSPDNLTQLLKEGAKEGAEGAVRLSRAAIPIAGEIAPLLGDESGSTLTAITATGSLASNVPSGIAILKGFYQQVSRYISQKRIVIIIDELDRCTPTYAIETLEAIHHVFNRDGITFVLGLHRQQLMESIKAIYGQGFDAEGYLDRFIDMTIPLSASRDDFIKAKLDQYIIFNKIPHFKRYAAQVGGQSALVTAGYAQQFLLTMPNINARAIDRFAKNLIAVMNVMPSNRDISYLSSVYATACIALAVKIQSPSRYQAFNEHSGRARDNVLYNMLGTSQLPHERVLARVPAMVAAILIAAQIDISLAISSQSEDERRQQTREVLSGISKFDAPRQQSESDKDTLNNATTTLKTHSPLYAQLCEQSGSIPDLVGEGLSWVTARDLSYPDRKLSHWQEVTNIIDLTT